MLYLVSLGLGVVSLVDGLGSVWARDVTVGVFPFGVLIPVLGVMVLLLFPTGRPPTNNWRWVVPVTWLAVLVMFAALGLEAMSTGTMTGDVQCDSAAGCTAIDALLVVLICAASAAISFVVRWRRSRGVEREQLRWLVPPFIVLLIGVVGEFGGGQDSWVADVFFSLGLFLVPVAIGIAITRYRLYEIDRIISRTVAYVVVVGVLGAVYAAGALWLPSLLFGEGTPLFVAGSTLSVAGLFNPVRRRVQRWVDRRFNRGNYDAERVMDDFAGTLRDRTDADHVVEGWVGVMSETMQPSAVGVWVR